MPFGEEVAPLSPPSDKRLFTGKERDNETALDYFEARYYRANLGRFSTVDPELNIKDALVYPQRWNRYSYVTNNPLKYTDPDGKNPLLIAGGIGAAVYGGWAIYQNVSSGAPHWYNNVGVEATKGLVVGLTLGLAAPAVAGVGAAEAAGVTATSVESGIFASAAKGRVGEVLADIVKNTERIPSATGTAAYRIPDVLDHANKVIGDVKNFSGTLSMSDQLRDFIAYAKDNGYTLILRVSDPSKVSKGLRTAIAQIGGRIEPIAQ